MCAYFHMLTSLIRVMYNTKRFQGTVDLSDEAGGEGVAGEEEGVEAGGEAEEASGCCGGVSVNRAILALEATNRLISGTNLTDQEPFFSTNPILSGAKLCFLKSSMIRFATSFAATMT